MPAPTYQDVVKANGAIGAWAMVEAAGTSFAPYIGATHLAGGGGLTYQQAGPFAVSEALGLAVGAFLHLPFGVQLNPPFTTESWVKLNSLAPPSYQLLLRNGVTAASGSGFYLQASDSHVHWTGSADVDTGFVWPDTSWHLLTWTTSAGGGVTRLYFDGVLVFSQGVGAAGGVPVTTGFLCDGNADNSHVSGLVSFPAVYADELAPIQVSANFLGASDPVAALALTPGGAGTIGLSNQTILDAILASVRRTY